MIGPQQDPRVGTIQRLSTQIDQFFAAGKSIVEVPPGVSGERLGGGMESRHAALRAARDKDAPTLRYLADQGYTVKQCAEAMGSDPKRLRLMARENGITFGGAL